MEKNWTCVYSTDKSYLAELIKRTLSDNDIRSVIINKKDSNYLFGLVEIYVERDNAVRSKHVIESMNENE